MNHELKTRTLTFSRLMAGMAMASFVLAACGPAPAAPTADTTRSHPHPDHTPRPPP